MGFFRKGSPFFPFWISTAACDPASVESSEVTRVPAGLLPVGEALCCRSVGATKEEACLICLIGTGGGRVEGKSVFIGGGKGLALVLAGAVEFRPRAGEDSLRVDSKARR